MPCKKQNSKINGLSLIETVLYLSLFSTLMVVVIPLVFDLVDWQSKQKQIDASIQNQIFLESRIRSLLVGSQAVIDPAPNATSTQLVVESSTAQEIKLLFLPNDGLVLEYADGNTIPLLATSTQIRDLIFFRTGDSVHERIHWSAMIDGLIVGTTTYLIGQE